MYGILEDFYWQIHITDLSVKTGKTQDLIISQSPYLGVLLILMPIFQILHFPEAEMARLPKKLNQKLGFSKKEKKIVKLENDEI